MPQTLSEDSVLSCPTMAYRILAISASVVGGWSSPGGILRFCQWQIRDAERRRKGVVTDCIGGSLGHHAGDVAVARMMWFV